MANRTLRSAAEVRWWIAAPCVAAALWFVPVPDWIVDAFYSRDLYPWLQNAATFVSNLAPFALIDLLVAIAAGLVVYRTGRFLVDVWRGRAAEGAWEVLRRVIRGVAVVVVVFVCEWGCNYRRAPLERAIAGGAAVPTVATLGEAIADANRLGAVLRPGLIAQPATSWEDAAAELPGPMAAALARLNQTPLARPGRPKISLVLSPFFRRAGVDGMIDPLALESILNPDLLPYERPFILAHEWSHLAGRADEAEASAVGWLACMNGPPAFAYSASLYLILEAGSALPAAARHDAYARLDPGVRADLVAIGRRLSQQQPEVQAAASRVYDRYLHANRVSDGNASYSRALTLILAEPLRGALTAYRER